MRFIPAASAAAIRVVGAAAIPSADGLIRWGRPLGMTMKLCGAAATFVPSPKHMEPAPASV
jgi:hypothetical protein